MHTLIRNRANISKKKIRALQKRFNRLQKKFDPLLYAEVHLAREGKLLTKATLRLGVPGHDVIVRARAETIPELWSHLYDKACRSMLRYKTRGQNLKKKA